jgi:hypothetical protein
VNGWSYLKHLTKRGAALSLTLALGLNAAQAQTPQTLPPYFPASRIGEPVNASPAIFIQNGDSKQAIKEQPRESPVAPLPAPAPVMVGEPAAADCPTCARGGRHSNGMLQFGGGCASGSCGRGGCGSGGCGSGGCATGSCGPQASYGCGYGGCFPGHKNCCPIDEGCGPFSRFFACFYHCLCCPDPCYEPRYIVEANSAFWVDGARPVTQTRLRYDSMHNFTQVDRSEWFWARSGGGGKGPGFVPNQINVNQIYLYQEAATARASFFIEQAYLGVSPDNGPTSSGFGDMNVGTKALLFDCELMQVTLQFRTFIPIGNAGKGLGTGHVSLEPSLLTTVKLLPETYVQGQLSEWIPIAADPAFGGSVLHYHMSLNHVLYRCTPDMPIIGTLEGNGYSFQDGLFSLPGGGVVHSSGDSWFTAGPGIRTSICNKIDFGFSAVFGLGQGGPEQIYRTEMRLRF